MQFIHQVEPLITEREVAAVTTYLRSGGWLTEFEETKAFEKEIAAFIGVDHAVCVTSGTVGLYLALLAEGVGPGDRVIVPNYTMIATPNAVRWTGADVILVDVDPVTMCLDLDSIPKDHNAKSMCYVEINGRSGRMDTVQSWCAQAGVSLIEDACQAMGSYESGRLYGSFGDCSVFSFTPHKIITTGQGGVVVTNNERVAASVRKLKDFHRVGAGKDDHDGIGYNFKFTDIQASIGRAQLASIQGRIQRKRSIFSHYAEQLSGIPELSFLQTTADTTPWFVDVCMPSRAIRDELVFSMKERGIGVRPWYPPLNHQWPYRSAGSRFPVSEDMAFRGAWLPSSMGITSTQLDYVCSSIKDFINTVDISASSSRVREEIA
jgi:perosamine synthetase